MAIYIIISVIQCIIQVLFFRLQLKRYLYRLGNFVLRLTRGEQ